MKGFNIVIIRRYVKNEDEEKLMKLIKNEGEEWSCYWADEFSAKYRVALHNSITYVAYEGDVLCGYSRSLDDCGFYIYICDLLVMPEHRGKNIGRRLMECIYEHYPDRIVYVMSDVDGYYKKQGFRRKGSIFEVIKSS
ncbi:MAG: GNAT family N-acetyltransferase [Eubacteriales bacterium]|nr:GNAT family N-acetyltransferase [Eubacteriales bacterium]